MASDVVKTAYAGRQVQPDSARPSETPKTTRSGSSLNTKKGHIDSKVLNSRDCKVQNGKRSNTLVCAPRCSEFETKSHTQGVPIDQAYVIKTSNCSCVVPNKPLLSYQTECDNNSRQVTSPSVRNITVACAPIENLAQVRLPLRPARNSCAFGLDAYPTRTKKNEVCYNFLNNRCPYGNMCIRIHPLPQRNLMSGGRASDTNRKHIDHHRTKEEHDEPPSSEIIVKLPPRGAQVQNTAFDCSTLNQEGERNCENAKGSIPYDRSNRLDQLFAKLSHNLTESPLSTELCRSELSNSDDDKYADLYYDSKSGFWGYPFDVKAWTDSETDTSDSSSFSSSRTSSQSSITDKGLSQTRRPGPFPSKYPPPYVHEAPLTEGKRPLPKFSETCINWLRNKCTRGYACNYMHGDIEYSAPVLVHKPSPPPKIPAPQWSVSVNNHATVKLDAGFEIKEVVTGFETPWMFLVNVPTHVTSEEIVSLVQPSGQVLDIRLPNRTASSSMNVKVRFSTSTEAAQASASLNGVQAFGVKIVARLPISNTSHMKILFQDTSVRIQWEAPSKVGYGGYSSMEHANKAIAAARIPFKDNYVKATIHTGLPVVGFVTVRFDGVPLDANEGDMERFAHPDDLVWERPNYLSLPRAIIGIRQILEKDTELLSFDVLPPPYKNGATVVAWAHFPTPNDAQAVSNRLNGRRPMFTGRTRVSARHMRSLTYPVNSEVFKKVGKDIQALCRSAWQRQMVSMSCIPRPAPAPVLVKLCGEDLKELGYLKSEFEKILNGEVLRESGKMAWDEFFAQPDGILFLNIIENQNPGVTIQNDISRKMIKLLGSSNNREMVRQKLLSKILQLRSQQVRTISLDGPLVGLFMSNELAVLKKKLGPENTFLDLWNRNLRIRGDDSAFNTAQEAVHNTRQRYNTGKHNPNLVECPVCFDKVTTPITLPCGHSWCSTCLSSYLISSIENKFFPLTCLGNDAKCKECIPLNIARKILPAQNFDAIVNAAFSSYVQSRPNEFHYCPSPDCPQIYRSASKETVLQCPSCLLRICPCCHVEAHDGLPCPETDDDDGRFREWMQNHDVKNCPGCKIPIERAEGCNHMTCIRCQTHICWECLQTFPRGEGIYDHMRSVHGGIGLAPIII